MKDFFSVHEVAKLLKVSRSGVLYHIKIGKLKATKVGKIYIISQKDFGDFLKHHRDEKKKKKKKSNQTKLKFE